MYAQSSRYNILPAISHRQCYCALHGYACFTELMPLSDRLLNTNRIHFNKQLVARKYLPFYDWVLFADSDVYFKYVQITIKYNPGCDRPV